MVTTGLQGNRPLALSHHKTVLLKAKVVDDFVVKLMHPLRAIRELETVSKIPDACAATGLVSRIDNQDFFARFGEVI